MSPSSEKLPVTGSVITWARERSGYSIKEIKKEFRGINLWESGEAFPSYPQLERMAKKFNCPIAVFFFPSPPEEENIEQSFRTLTENDFENIPVTVKALLRKGRAMQINLSELCDEKNPSKKLVTQQLQFEIGGSVETMAEKLRSHLNLPIEEQFSWGSTKEALENWREIVGKCGVFVFKAPFKTDQYSGFCLYNAEFPIIYINNTATKAKQIFTLFHELAHLIFHTSGIDSLNDEYINHLPENEKKIETICNRFAGKFLVPDNTFDKYILDIQDKRDRASSLAEKYCVSREVIYRKFLDKGMIDEKEYSKAAGVWTGEIKNAGKGGSYYYNQKTYLGNTYIDLAFKGYYQNRFDVNQLAEYLDIKPKNVSTFEERYIRARVSE